MCYGSHIPPQWQKYQEQLKLIFKTAWKEGIKLSHWKYIKNEPSPIYFVVGEGIAARFVFWGHFSSQS
jgi:hypothetical protein